MLSEHKFFAMLTSGDLSKLQAIVFDYKVDRLLWADIRYIWEQSRRDNCRLIYWRDKELFDRGISTPQVIIPGDLCCRVKRWPDEQGTDIAPFPKPSNGREL